MATAGPRWWGYTQTERFKCQQIQCISIWVLVLTHDTETENSGHQQTRKENENAWPDSLFWSLCVTQSDFSMWEKAVETLRWEPLSHMRELPSSIQSWKFLKKWHHTDVTWSWLHYPFVDMFCCCCCCCITPAPQSSPVTARGIYRQEEEDNWSDKQIHSQSTQAPTQILVAAVVARIEILEQFFKNAAY